MPVDEWISLLHHRPVSRKDISSYLQEWPYEPGKLSVRKFTGDDGIEKIQLRVDLGILQMNVNGRPDGTKPFDSESLYDYLKSQSSKGEIDGTDFTLTNDQVSELQQEALQYYHRYICFYEMNEHALVVRDTNRNLELIDFIDDFAENDFDLSNLSNLKPQLLMMLAHSQSILLNQNGRKEEAIAALKGGIEEIEDFYAEFQGIIEEPSNEKQILSKLLSDLKDSETLTHEERLQIQMRQAVEKEEYEKAAEIRDALRSLSQ